MSQDKDNAEQPDDEAAVEELLRSLEQELKESGKFPSEETLEKAEAVSDLEESGVDDHADEDDYNADEPDGSQVVFGLSADIEPREMFAELSNLFGKLAEGSGKFGSLFDGYEPTLQLAIKVATEDKPEPTVEPAHRMRLEELFRVAELHINSTAGLPMDAANRKPDILTRKEWVTNLLKDFWPIFSPEASEEISLGDPMALVQNLMIKLSSTARLMQIGGMLGELSHSAFGYYVLPIPPPTRKSSRPIGILSSNIEAFSKEWALDFDQAGLWVCTTEILSHTILSRPVVRDTLWQLYEDYIAEIDDSAAFEWEEKLKDFEHSFMGDPAEVLQSLFGETGEVAIQFSDSEEQREMSRQISAIVTAVVGHVQYLTDKVTNTLLGPGANLTEAFRRQQLKTSETSNFGKQILGISLDLEQGLEFISELVSVKGEAVLESLWSSETALPTPAEIESPRLWLARMDLL